MFLRTRRDLFQVKFFLIRRWEYFGIKTFPSARLLISIVGADVNLYLAMYFLHDVHDVHGDYGTSRNLYPLLPPENKNPPSSSLKL